MVEIMKSNNALIGDSGYVGSTLRRQIDFKCHYRSNNILEIDGLSLENIVCAAAPAQKWIANREPEADLHKIESLIKHLRTVQCNTFILISTVDVFENSTAYQFSLDEEKNIILDGKNLDEVITGNKRWEAINLPEMIINVGYTAFLNHYLDNGVKNGSDVITNDKSYTFSTDVLGSEPILAVPIS